MIDARKILAIGNANLLRQVRDRSDLFFVFVLPTIIILALGIQFGGGTHVRLGVVAPAGDQAAAALVDELRATTSIDVVTEPTADDLRSAVERGRLEAGVVIPDGFGASLAAAQPVAIAYVAAPGALTSGVRAPVDAAVARLNAIGVAAVVAASAEAVPVASARTVAASLAPSVAGVSVQTSVVGEAGAFAGFSGFTVGASSQLVLFMFLTSLTAAGRLVYTRRLGVSRRMVSTPTSAGTIVTGEALGRFWIVMLQAGYIVVVSAVLFGVSWGDPLAAGVLIGLFGVTAAAIALLVGAISRDPDQASSIGVFVGLAFGALGGCMVPYQFMPPVMQTIARLFPQSWTLLGLQSLIRDGGGLASVAPNVAVLTVWAVGAMTVAAWRFRRSITG